MRKGTFIATIALLIAIAGAIVAFAAYITTPQGICQ